MFGSRHSLATVPPRQGRLVGGGRAQRHRRNRILALVAIASFATGWAGPVVTAEVVSTRGSCPARRCSCSHPAGASSDCPCCAGGAGAHGASARCAAWCGCGSDRDQATVLAPEVECALAAAPPLPGSHGCSSIALPRPLSVHQVICDPPEPVPRAADATA